MRSALFVDDEPLVLEGLRRMLRPLRKDWQMTFAASAQDACRALEEQRFDVVVCDMRMPGMDGAALLEHVRIRQPEAARIMLTGQTDREATLRMVGCAHRFLSKPCEPESLERTLERACALRELVRHERVAAAAAALGRLPSLPEIYDELNRVLASPDCTPKRMAETLAKDIAMTAKVLQLVNSAFFGVRRKVTAVEQAAMLLGTELIRAIVLSDCAFAALAAGTSQDEFDALRRHSLAVGAAARAIARHEGAEKGIVDEATQGGFLHDIGRLVLATALPQEAAAARALAARERTPLPAAELALVGCTHAALGAYVLGLWGLPEAIVETVAYHHDPDAVRVGGFAAVTAVFAADALVTAGAEAARPALAAAGLEHKLQEWAALTVEAPAESEAS